MNVLNRNINNVFFIFALSHLIVWTLVPSITNNNLPLDTIEALAWGSNLDWGFNKHPPMSAFFPEVFYKIFGAQDWAYYLLSLKDNMPSLEHQIFYKKLQEKKRSSVDVY